MRRISLFLLLVCGCVAVVRDDAAVGRLRVTPQPVCTQPTRVEGEADVPLDLFLNLPVVVATVNGKRFTLLVDTGSQPNLMSPSLAERLDLPVSDAGELVLLGRSAPTRSACVDLLRIGSLSAHHARFLLSPGYSTKSVLGFTTARVDGVIGMSLLRHRCLTIDAPGRRVLLREPGHRHMPSGPQVHAVPLLMLDDGRPAVTVSLGDGPRRIFLLDTGTNMCVVRETAAVADGTLQQGTVRLLSLGVETPASLARFKTLTLGMLTFTNVEASVVGRGDRQLAPDIDGIVGMALLGTHRITLDPARAVMFVE